MKKILFIAGIFIGALMARAADDVHSVTIGRDHLVKITAVVKTSPTTVMIRSDGRMMQVEIKELPEPFLAVWNISTKELPVGFEPGQDHTTTMPNETTLDLIWIAPGTFTMGSPDSEDQGNSYERPVHQVTISKGFWLGKTPVTQGQYQSVMGYNPSHYPKAGADAPVEWVSWNEAMDFCQQLTERERAAGHLLKGYAYTLPTEAQWEYACRAGTTEARYGKLSDIAWWEANSGGTTHRVAQKQPNAWGLYDMLGNVAEWCSDWFAPFHDGNVTDPVGPSSGETRVLKGAACLYEARYCRAGCRGGNRPGDSGANLGFRLALRYIQLDQVVASAKPPVTAQITLSNEVTLELVWIAPGTFTMGSPASEPYRNGHEEGPQTVVTISKGFWLEETPVTQGQYQAIMGNNPSDFPGAGPGAPVERVTWDDAMAFCRTLTEQKRAAGRLRAGYVYTLPTEAQWEYACRAGTTGAQYDNLDDIAWYRANSGGTTHPVAQKQPNAWGLYDMLGNVAEWCSDWHGPYPGGKVTDPVGPASGTDHIYRGCSWYDQAYRCRSAHRDYSSYVGNIPDHALGFRVAFVPAR